MHIRIHFDGAVSESKIGCDIGIGVACFVNGQYQEDLCKFVGHKGWHSSSSNVAEWMACIEALITAVDYFEHGDKIEIVSDSQLIVNQFNGEYQITKPHFQELYRQAKIWADKISINKIKWVPREENQEADRLSKKGLALVYVKPTKAKKTKADKGSI